MERISADIHHLPELVGGPTILLADDYVTLVDTGLPGQEETILAAIETLGRDRSELRQILITHADGDHVGSLAAIAEATGAAVYAGSYEAEVIEGRQPTRAGETREPFRVDHRVEPGDTIPLHGGIEVIATFGHTLGHVAYYLPAAGVLIAGDCINNAEGLTGSRPEFTADADQAREAVRAVAALQPSTVCFGHGPSLVGDAAEQLAALATTL